MYFNLLTLFGLLTFWGGAVYRVYQLNYQGVFAALVLTLISFIVLKKMEKGKVNSQQLTANSKQELKATQYTTSKNIYYTAGLLAIYCLLLVFNFFILWQSQTTTSIISPWEVVPWYFFVTYTLASLALIAVILNLKSKILNLSLLSLHILLSVSVAVIVYTLGYGFDPFIHQATEQLIAAQGFVNPRPLYYLGPYALIVIAHKLFFIPVVWLDKLLVPVLAAVFLPVAFHSSFIKIFKDNVASLFSVTAMFVLPLAIFTITTPQNLAYLFLILLVLLSLSQTSEQHNVVSLQVVLSLATLATHPIAGIPAVLFVAMLYAQKIKNKKLLLTAYCVLFTFSSISLPAAFAFTNSRLNPADSVSASPAFQLPKAFFSDTGSVWLNFSYLYGFNITWFVLALIVTGLVIYYNKISNIKYPISNIYFLMPLALLISYAITKTLSFSYLISYERANFADRILIVAVIFALPFVMTTIAALVKTILIQRPIVKYSFICFFVFLSSVSLYHSYPRYDAYDNSRSFSTSKADIDAVRWIEQDARGRGYMVLANQQVSAAALREFGFKQYYNTNQGELFYYPIPTGAPTYQYYLDMVYKNADKNTALRAAELVGTDTVYFVLNNYWFGFEKIIAEARVGAAAVKNIGEGEVLIFKYKK